LPIILNVCASSIDVLTVFQHPGNHSIILTIILSTLVLTIILNVCGLQIMRAIAPLALTSSVRGNKKAARLALFSYVGSCHGNETWAEIEVEALSHYPSSAYSLSQIKLLYGYDK